MADNTNTAQALADSIEWLRDYCQLPGYEQAEAERLEAHLPHIKRVLASLASQGELLKDGKVVPTNRYTLASQAAEQEPVAHLWRYRNPKHCRPQGWNIGRPEWADEEVEVIAVVPAGTAPVREQSEREAELLMRVHKEMHRIYGDEMAPGQDAWSTTSPNACPRDRAQQLQAQLNHWQGIAWDVIEMIDAAIAAKKEHGK